MPKENGPNDPQNGTHSHSSQHQLRVFSDTQKAQESQATQQPEWDTDDQEDPFEKWMRWRNDPFRRRLKATDIVIAAFTICLSFVAVWQGLILRRQLGEMKRATTLDERAWVGPVGESVRGLDFAKGQGEYTMTIKNFGKTPALGAMWPTEIFPDDASRVVSTQNAQCDTRMYDRDPGGEWGHVLWPGENQVPVKLPKVEHTLNIPKVRTIYVVGCITYRDVFGKHHWTRFCYYSTEPQNAEQEFTNCYQHNKTDDDER